MSNPARQAYMTSDNAVAIVPAQFSYVAVVPNPAFGPARTVGSCGNRMQNMAKADTRCQQAMQTYAQLF